MNIYEIHNKEHIINYKVADSMELVVDNDTTRVYKLKEDVEIIEPTDPISASISTQAYNSTISPVNWSGHTGDTITFTITLEPNYSLAIVENDDMKVLSTTQTSPGVYRLVYTVYRATDTLTVITNPVERTINVHNSVSATDYSLKTCTGKSLTLVAPFTIQEGAEILWKDQAENILYQGTDKAHDISMTDSITAITVTQLI